ncbi:hypothetical protein LXL04_008415 [Taraxacum kok-saghyz]
MILDQKLFGNFVVEYRTNQNALPYFDRKWTGVYVVGSVWVLGGFTIPQTEPKPKFSSGSFENSYILENPRTPKPLTFSKNDFGRLKIAQIQARSQKKNSEKTNFFFNFCISFLKQNKKMCTYVLKKKKSFFRKNIFATGLVFERFLAPRSRFFEKFKVYSWQGHVPKSTKLKKNKKLSSSNLLVIEIRHISHDINFNNINTIGIYWRVFSSFYLITPIAAILTLRQISRTIKAKATILEKPFASSCCIPTDENLQAKSFKFLIELQALRYGVDLMDPLFTFGRETWANNGTSSEASFGGCMIFFGGVQFSSPCSCFSGLAQLPEMVPELENYQGWNLCLLFDFLPLEKSCLIPQRHNV